MTVTHKEEKTLEEESSPSPPLSHNSRNLLIWGLIATLVVAGIIVTVVLVDKNRSTSNNNIGGRSNGGGTRPARTPNAACPNPRVRKEWRELSQGEKNAYFTAIKTLKTQPSQMNYQNRYDDWVAIHGDNLYVVHNTSRFLPWHRHFVFEFENELRRIDASITVPYWDWGLDAQRPSSSPILSPNDFGGDGDPTTKCLVDGAFVGWQGNYRYPHCVQRSFINGTGYIEKWWSSTSVGAIILSNVDFWNFARTLEKFPHGDVHKFLGGDMLDPGISANDPLFFLHHANIDRYFWIWQQEHPSNNMLGGDGIQDTEAMSPYTEPLKRAFEIPDRSAYYCYTYTASVQPIGTHSLLNVNPRLQRRESSDRAAPQPARNQVRTRTQAQPRNSTARPSGSTLNKKRPLLQTVPHTLPEWAMEDPCVVEAIEAKHNELISILNNEIPYTGPSATVQANDGRVDWVPVKQGRWRYDHGSSQREALEQALQILETRRDRYHRDCRSSSFNSHSKHRASH